MVERRSRAGRGRCDASRVPLRNYSCTCVVLQSRWCDVIPGKVGCAQHGQRAHTRKRDESLPPRKSFIMDARWGPHLCTEQRDRFQYGSFSVVPVQLPGADDPYIHTHILYIDAPILRAGRLSSTNSEGWLRVAVRDTPRGCKWDREEGGRHTSAATMKTFPSTFALPDRP